MVGTVVHSCSVTRTCTRGMVFLSAIVCCLIFNFNLAGKD